MIATQLAAAIGAARPSHLDDIGRTIWKTYAAGLLTDDEAQGLAEAVEARRALQKALQTTQKPAPQRVGSRPRSQASLERRRRWVAAGMLPPSIAAQFTMGEAAALAVVAIEAQTRGRCELVFAAIAATAGVSVTTAKNAVREARRLGLIEVRERRASWTRNLSNVVTILAPEWRDWLRLGARRGGGKSVTSTPTHIKSRPFRPFEGQGGKPRKGLSGPPSGAGMRGRRASA